MAVSRVPTVLERICKDFAHIDQYVLASLFSIRISTNVFCCIDIIRAQSMKRIGNH